MTSPETSRYFYRHHPQNCAEDDFWSQVKHTVGGKPIAEEQVALLVSAVKSGLNLTRQDRLLDLCCGNGALTTRLFELCDGGLGVDISEFLIGVAKKYFGTRKQDQFKIGDMVEFVETAHDAADYTKMLCHGGFQYLTPAAAPNFLETLRLRFVKLERVFLGNLPDKARIHDFVSPQYYKQGMEDDCGTPFGIWRTESEFAQLAKDAGWAIEIRRMPPEYYSAHYRYDAVLSRS